MGVDSLMALELRNRLESAVERALPATLAWNYPTIEQLTAHLDAEVAPDPAIDEPTTFATVATPDDDGLAQLLQGVTTLSDDDVARALRGAR